MPLVAVGVGFREPAGPARPAGVVLALYDEPDLVGVLGRGGDVPAGEGREGFHLGRGLAHGSARGGGLPGGLGVPETRTRNIATPGEPTEILDEIVGNVCSRDESCGIAIHDGLRSFSSKSTNMVAAVGGYRTRCVTVGNTSTPTSSDEPSTVRYTSNRASGIAFGGAPTKLSEKASCGPFSHISNSPARRTLEVCALICAPDQATNRPPVSGN